MDQGTASRGLTDRGIGSVQFLVSAALALLIFVAFVNVVIVQYGRGAVRSALEQGARAGSLAGSISECEATAHDVLTQLMGGAMSDGLVVSCRLDGVVVVAEAVGVFESWTPLAPDWPVSLSSDAVIEPDQ